MYIGELEIKGVKFIEGSDTVAEVTFEGEHPPVKLNKSLVDNLTTEEKGRGNVTDNVNHHFSKQFLAEMALSGLEFYSVEGVAMAMRVLAHNLREEAIKKAFNCSGGDTIPLETLMAEPDEEYKTE
jgi:hypothetical protein